MNFKPSFSVHKCEINASLQLEFCFHPVLIFGNLVDTLLKRLCTDGTNFSMQIIVDDGRYLGSAADMLMSREPTIITLVY